jgi:hypothetical protein
MFSPVVVDQCQALGRSLQTEALAALAAAPAASVAFIVDLADALGRELIESYAPASKRLGARCIDGNILVFALTRENALALLSTPRHRVAGSAILQQLRDRLRRDDCARAPRITVSSGIVSLADCDKAAS